MVDDLIENHEAGVPILVGTTSVEKSAAISRILTKKGIPHSVLNAKNHENEAYIVAQAGRLKAITVSTNMAGRGTNILLGDNPEHMARQQAIAEGVAEKVVRGEEKYVDDEEFVNFFMVDSFYRVKTADWERIYGYFKQACGDEHKDVVSLGGLHIIGTERHEARRIDNQLRGGAGRQIGFHQNRFVFVSILGLNERSLPEFLHFTQLMYEVHPHPIYLKKVFTDHLPHLNHGNWETTEHYPWDLGAPPDEDTFPEIIANLDLALDYVRPWEEWKELYQSAIQRVISYEHLQFVKRRRKDFRNELAVFERMQFEPSIEDYRAEDCQDVLDFLAHYFQNNPENIYAYHNLLNPELMLPNSVRAARRQWQQWSGHQNTSQEMISLPVISHQTCKIFQRVPPSNPDTE